MNTYKITYTYKTIAAMNPSQKLTQEELSEIHTDVAIIHARTQHDATELLTQQTSMLLTSELVDIVHVVQVTNELFESPEQHIKKLQSEFF